MNARVVVAPGSGPPEFLHVEISAEASRRLAELAELRRASRERLVVEALQGYLDRHQGYLERHDS